MVMKLPNVTEVNIYSLFTSACSLLRSRPVITWSHYSDVWCLVPNPPQPGQLIPRASREKRSGNGESTPLRPRPQPEAQPARYPCQPQGGGVSCIRGLAGAEGGRMESGSALVTASGDLCGIKMICLPAWSCWVPHSEVGRGAVTFTENEAIIHPANGAVKVSGRRKVPFSTKADKIWLLTTSQYIKLHLSRKSEEGEKYLV